MRSFYSPLSISAPFYGYLKLLATRKGKESKQGCEIRESNSGPLAPRPRTNRLCHPFFKNLINSCALLKLNTLKLLNFFAILGKALKSTNYVFTVHFINLQNLIFKHQLHQNLFRPPSIKLPYQSQTML